MSELIYSFDIPAERPWSCIIKRGQTLRIIDSGGQQAVDAHPGQPQLLADFGLRIAANKIEPGRPGGQLLFRIKS